MIVESAALKATLQKFAKCELCNSAVSAKLRMCCLATKIVLECHDPDCECDFHSDPPAGTKIHEGKGDNFERTTDYALNVLFVTGMISCGDGSTEASRLLGLLGLPMMQLWRGILFMSLKRELVQLSEG